MTSSNDCNCKQNSAPQKDPWGALPDATETLKAFDAANIIDKVITTINSVKKRALSVDISDILLDNSTTLKYLKGVQDIVEAGLSSKRYKTAIRGFESIVEQGNDIMDSDHGPSYRFVVDWSK
jgi:hypothetical protein